MRCDDHDRSIGVSAHKSPTRMSRYEFSCVAGSDSTFSVELLTRSFDQLQLAQGGSTPKRQLRSDCTRERAQSSRQPVRPSTLPLLTPPPLAAS